MFYYVKSCTYIWDERCDLDLWASNLGQGLYQIYKSVFYSGHNRQVASLNFWFYPGIFNYIVSLQEGTVLEICKYLRSNFRGTLHFRINLRAKRRKFFWPQYWGSLWPLEYSIYREYRMILYVLNYDIVRNLLLYTFYYDKNERSHPTTV